MAQIIGSKGLKTIYGLKKLAVIPESTLAKATTQILGGLTLVARAAAFPPLNFAVANIASILVAEAIASIVLALFKEDNKIEDLLQKSDYLKGNGRANEPCEITIFIYKATNLQLINWLIDYTYDCPFNNHF
jgi:hypothetical protein